MKKIIFVLIFLFILTSCSNKDRGVINELIDDSHKTEHVKDEEKPNLEEKIVVKIYPEGYLYRVGRDYFYSEGIPDSLKQELDKDIFDGDIIFEGHKINSKFIKRKYVDGFLVGHDDHTHFIPFEWLKENIKVDR